MGSGLSEDQLRTKALAVLEEHLGPADAMRFLSLLRNQPRDYQRWREEHFKDLTAEELLEQMRSVESEPGHGS